MAKPKYNNFDEIADQLANDSDFVNLPEEEQNQIIDEARNEFLGVVPKHQSFLNQMIKGVTGGMNLSEPERTAYTTASNVLGGAPQAILENPMKFAMGGVSGAGSGALNPEIDLQEEIEPQSALGQITSIVAPMLLGTGAAGTGAVKGIKSLIGGSKKSAELAYKGGKVIGRRQDAIGKLLSKKYGKAIREMEETGLNKFDFNQMIDDAIKNLDPSTINDPGSGAQVLNSIKSQLKIPINTPISGQRAKSIINTIESQLSSNPGAQKVFGDAKRAILKLKAPQLANLEKQFATTTEGVKSTKRIKGTLSRIAHGKATPEEVADVTRLEARNLGTNVIPGLAKQGAKLARGKTIAKGLGYAGGAGLAAGGLNWFKDAISK